MKSATVSQFFETFSDDTVCLEHLFNSRFGQNHTCPKCERPAKWYPIQAQRAYSCQWCGHHIHPTAGTIFEDTRTPLRSWFYAMYLFTTTRHGVSAKELQRQLGVTYKTAWRMGHKIREHMAATGGKPPLSGNVEIDEAYIGHKGRKTTVLGIVERGGDVVTQVIPATNRSIINKALTDNVKRGSVVHSDSAVYYNDIRNLAYQHKTVNHKAKEWVRGTVHVNTIEGFWGMLKRGIKGTHIHISTQHIEKYCGEFQYRYNRRNTPEVMIGELLASF